MNKIDAFLLKLQKIPVTEKIFLLQNLSVIIKTGIALVDGLSAIGAQTKNKKMQIVLSEAAEKIKQGSTFGESLEKYQADFGEMFINIIKAGEVSGRLDEVLHNLYTQTKKDHEITSKIRGAMIYPGVILTAMIGIGIFLVIFVLPNITKMFSDLDMKLPLATKIIINFSLFTQKHGLILGLTTLAIIIVAVNLVRSRVGKRIVDQIFLRLPVLSTVVKKINIARIARNLNALLKTDIDIVKTLKITASVLGNSLYRQALLESAESVKKGERLGLIFKNYPALFPPVIIQMITIGEESGSLDEIMEKVADFYEEEVAQTMENLPAIIEPILMLVMGAAVAGVALAIMMPMYSLVQGF